MIKQNLFSASDFEMGMFLVSFYKYIIIVDLWEAAWLNSNTAVTAN